MRVKELKEVSATCYGVSYLNSEDDVINKCHYNEDDAEEVAKMMFRELMKIREKNEFTFSISTLLGSEFAQFMRVGEDHPNISYTTEDQFLKVTHMGYYWIETEVIIDGKHYVTAKSECVYVGCNQ